MTAAEMIAQRFHELYEELAPSFGYKTREASAVPWEDVPKNNKELMIAVVKGLLDSGLIIDLFEAGGNLYENLGDAMRVRNGQPSMHPPVA